MHWKTPFPPSTASGVSYVSENLSRCAFKILPLRGARFRLRLDLILRTDCAQMNGTPHVAHSRNVICLLTKWELLTTSIFRKRMIQGQFSGDGSPSTRQ